MEGKNINNLEELLAITGSNFNILEEEIDIEIQKEYIIMARFMKKHPDFPQFQQKYKEDASELFDPDIPDNAKKKILITLASIPEPTAYRTIEKFSKMDTPLRGWAVVTLQQSRILLQSSLLDDPGIFISTGLGGQGSLLRFFIVLIHADDEGLKEYQFKLLKDEMAAAIEKSDGVIEEIETRQSFTTILALLPLSTDLPNVLNGVIHECNQYGNFLRKNMIVTNVKKIPDEEILRLLKKKPSKHPSDL